MSGLPNEDVAVPINDQRSACSPPSLVSSKTTLTEEILLTEEAGDGASDGEDVSVM